MTDPSVDPASIAPPPVPPHLLKRDQEHLRLLAIFHFVGAALSALGIGFLFLHYTFMSKIFANPEMWEQGSATPPPEEFIALFEQVMVWFYVGFGIISLAQFFLSLASGFFLLKRRHRVFCMVAGAIDCLNMPLGTILGIFTLIVLNRSSVHRLFESQTET